MTKLEIERLRKEWERRHPGKTFNQMLRNELSGRDESDILDMAIHGAPESAKAQIEQERRRVEREINDLTGVLGGVAAGNEAAWMEGELKRLQELSEAFRERRVAYFGECGLADIDQVVENDGALQLTERIAERIQLGPGTCFRITQRRPSGCNSWADCNNMSA